MAKKLEIKNNLIYWVWELGWMCTGGSSVRLKAWFSRPWAFSLFSSFG